MKIPIFFLVSIIVLSCSDRSTEPEPLKVIKTTTLHAYDYASNFFFLDTVYKSIYKDYWINYIPVIPNTEIARYNRIKEIEVWESTNDIKKEEISCLALAFSDLNPLKIYTGEKYSSDMKKSGIVPGLTEKAIFVKMDTTEFFIDWNLGIINIINLRTDRFYAISYRIEGKTPSADDDLFFGDFSTQTNDSDTLILKLIYRPNMHPEFSSLWQRQIKNKYYVGENYVDVSKSEIEIYYLDENNKKRTYLDKELPLNIVTILGVDKFNSLGFQIPDGKFDILTWVFDRNNGIITFPSLEPFNESIIEFFTINDRPDKAAQYIYPEIYNSTKDDAKLAVDKDRYLIVFTKLGK